MSKNTGGQAFPSAVPHIAQNNATGETTQYQYLSDGMSLRDYFAAKAMNGLCGAYFELLKDEQWTGEFRKPVEEAVEICGKLSYYIADAMLAARDK